MTNRTLKVTVLAVVEIRIPMDTSIDLDEFEEWAGPDTEPTADKILKFLESGRDFDVDEFIGSFPKADPDRHEVLDAYLDLVKTHPTTTEGTNPA